VANAYLAACTTAFAGSGARNGHGEVSEEGDVATGGVTADVILGTAMTLTFALNIGERLRVPVWVAKLAPDIPTRAFPLPGSSPSFFGAINYRSYVCVCVCVCVCACVAYYKRHLQGIGRAPKTTHT